MATFCGWPVNVSWRTLITLELVGNAADLILNRGFLLSVCLVICGRQNIMLWECSIIGKLYGCVKVVGSTIEYGIEFDTIGCFIDTLVKWNWADIWNNCDPIHTKYLKYASWYPYYRKYRIPDCAILKIILGIYWSGSDVKHNSLFSC